MLPREITGRASHGRFFFMFLDWRRTDYPTDMLRYSATVKYAQSATIVQPELLRSIIDMP